MLKDLGVKYVIVGHSERRQYFCETDTTVNKKVHAVLNAGMNPIICVGESLEQREKGVTFEHITMQLKLDFAGIVPEQLRRVIIAYEPIWAIGTGLTATPEEAEEVCQHIRTVVRKLSSAKTARATSILYGGSMNDKNAESLLAQPDIDGGLIGGASLDPEKFIRIINAANQEAE
jgi:triosephosphate isomerase